MATNFPGSQDSFTNPSPGDALSSPSHSQQHADVNDAVEAIEGALLDGAPLHIDDTNGRVGIGTDSPQTPLHISQTGADALRIQKSNNDQQGSYISIWDDDSRLGYIGYAGNDDLYLENEASAGKTFLSTGGATRLTVDSSGNVGIGTTSPDTILHVMSASNTLAHFESTDPEAIIAFSDSDSTGNWYNRRLGAIGDDMSFWTSNARRVTIDYLGNVGIGTTSPGAMLDVRGGVQTHRILPFSDNTYDLGANVLRWDDVYATNGTIQTSDERDKSSITDIDLGLAFVNGLRPVTYTWDDRSGNVGARTHMGFVAQEVATALGDEASNRAVWIHASAEQTTDPETGEVDEGRDIQGLRYNELLAPLVKAVQELSATVGTLTARIEALEAN
jgi:hypothetical protein